MSSHFENIFSKLQSSFKQGLSAQYSLISMIEKWKKSVDKEQKFFYPSYGPVQSFRLSPTIVECNAYEFKFSVVGFSDGTKYSRMDQVKFVEECL